MPVNKQGGKGGSTHKISRTQSFTWNYQTGTCKNKKTVLESEVDINGVICYIKMYLNRVALYSDYCNGSRRKGTPESDTNV